jgi:hypothetical protein
VSARGKFRGVADRCGSLLVVLVGLGALPPTAASAPPADTAAIAVYVEVLPSSTGGVVPQRVADAAPVPLLQPAQAAVEESGGADAEVLERVATAPALGAPPSASAVEPESVASTKVAIPTLVGSLAEESARGQWLIGGLALVTGIAVGAAIKRRRSP